MLSSLEEDLSELVLCSICIELLSDTRVLRCGHTFCLGCLQRYGSRRRPGDCLPCPMCRSDFEVPSGGFADLPRNFLLEKILEIHANALAALDSAVVVVVEDPVEKEDFLEQSQPQNQLTTSELQLQDDDNYVQSNMQQQQRNQSGEQQQPIRQRHNAVQRHQGVVEQQEQPQQEQVQPQIRQLEQREQQQQEQQQPDQDLLQQEQRRERRRQQLQQRQQRRQLELQQQQQQMQRQLEQRRWQFHRQRRRLSTVSCGCWSTRVIVISIALNFILAGSLWHMTERLEENETKLSELIEEDAKKKEIIDSSELGCQNRVFQAVQRYEQDIDFYKAYLRTMMTALEKAGRPKETTFNVLD